jgi:polyhydroxyalkanoate synthase subunit PhaC
MRNPPRYTFDKYLKLFKRYNDKQFVDTFISVGKWLYDTPIIPGNLYRQVINDCYKNNLLISHKMKVDGNIIDLAERVGS